MFDVLVSKFRLYYMVHGGCLPHQYRLVVSVFYVCRDFINCKFIYVLGKALGERN